MQDNKDIIETKLVDGVYVPVTNNDKKLKLKKVRDIKIKTPAIQVVEGFEIGVKLLNKIAVLLK